MNREVKALRASLALAVAFLVVVPSARAQSPLERLEQQIRQRNAATAADGSPAQDQPPAPMIMSAAVGEAPPHEPAYLGMAVDDQRDRGRGVRIVAVRPGGPAARAGLRPQDLVTAVRNVRVRQMADLSDILDTFAPGQTATFEVLRGEKKQTLSVTFGRRPTEAKAAGSTPPPPTPQRGDRPSPSPQPMLPPPGSAKGQPESIPSPAAEPVPEPPEQPTGPALVPPKNAAPAQKAETPKKAEPQDASQRIDQLQRRIEELERRVAELERALAKSAK